MKKTVQNSYKYRQAWRELLMTLFCAGSLFSFSVHSLAYAQTEVQNQEGYLFSADRVAYDEQYNIVVAVGNVEIHTDKEIIRADTITLYEKEERLEAEGNVSLTDGDGNTYFTNKISLTDSGNRVFAEGIKALLNDESRMTGATGYRVRGEKVVLRKAQYSPCKGCQKNPEAALPWQIKAEKVVHDEQEKMIVYRNATLEMWDVPVMWTPYFSHPDPSVKQKSGFLKPAYGFKSDLGTMVSGSYYWALAPHHDLTTRVLVTTQQGPLGEVEYRRRFEQGDFYIKGSGTQSDRLVRRTTGDITKPNSTRGHIDSKLNYHIDEKWRAGWDIFRTSDDQYASLYDYTQTRVFENRLFAERYDNRDFTSLQFLYFQDTRLLSNIDQPAVLPWMMHDMYGDADGVPLVGGRWRLRSSLLGLRRNDGQDMNRVMLDGDWNKRLISDYGLHTNLTASSNLAWYHVNDSVAAQLDPTLQSTTSEVRAYPQIHAVTSYPFVRYNPNSRVVLEPLVALSYGSRLSNRNIPNEDSNDLLLDWSNLFDANRFPGSDRLEDGLRTTYGMNAGLFEDNGSLFNIFLGQSYRFTDSNIFPQNAGLEDKGSDYVGGIQLNYLNNIFFDYGLQVDDESLNARRHEFSGRFLYNNLTAGVSYFYDLSVSGTGLDTKREQIEPRFIYRASDKWRVGGDFLYDFSPNQDGLIRARTNLEYILDCLTIHTGVRRNLINRASGESDIVFTLGLSFKNLGSVGN